MKAALALDCDHPRRVDLRAQELLLSGSAEGLSDLAVRAPARDRRLDRAAGVPGADAHRHHAHPSWRKTRASRCTTASPTPIARRISISIAAACRSSRSSPSPTCDRPQTRRPASRASARLVVALGVNDGNMEEGSLRCDANVSVRPAGTRRSAPRPKSRTSTRSGICRRRSSSKSRGRSAVARGAASACAQETRLWDSDSGRDAVDAQQGRSARLSLFPGARLAAARGRRRPRLQAMRAGAARVAGCAQSAVDLGVRPQRVRRRCARAADGRRRGVLRGDGRRRRAAQGRQQLDPGRGSPRAQGPRRRRPVSRPDFSRRAGRARSRSSSAASSAARSPRTCSRRCGPAAGPRRRSSTRKAWRRLATSPLLQRSSPTSSPRHPDVGRAVPRRRNNVLGFLVGQVMKASGGKANPRS